MEDIYETVILEGETSIFNELDVRHAGALDFGIQISELIGNPLSIVEDSRFVGFWKMKKIKFYYINPGTNKHKYLISAHLDQETSEWSISMSSISAGWFSLSRQ